MCSSDLRWSVGIAKVPKVTALESGQTQDLAAASAGAGAAEGADASTKTVTATTRLNAVNDCIWGRAA